MDLLELKFLLELLGFPDYRAPIAKIKLNPKTNAAERDNLCRSLRERELVDFNFEVTLFSIAPPGKSLLKLDTTGLPISKPELAVLEACSDSAITPNQTELPAQERQKIIKGLVERGLIKAEKTQITEVWLTQRGQEYLLWEYNPSGSTPILNLDMLRNYLRFMRRSMRERLCAKQQEEASREISLPTLVKTEAAEYRQEKQEEERIVKETTAAPLTDADILKVIRDLDRELGTDNYLPIYHLRQKLQPPLTREELDKALYRLQRHDKIELSSLQEALAYTPEQIEAGIPQDVGGPLFFIITL
ncbi:MAG: hypothetical protein N3E45_13915 [Oscillatoriaceae bacterium SKW80]|nr:hypothetical protein [Oscillatoriaceae bacterium SKYG93]MCX8121896.1 hypothetical protein [Oscillatoriaceae bacterium SKW80]MDW8454657.1 hypothetical protein [Oscillatoriaceae cyanobacterium SKYGB_i_bin93]HIK28638.1 hypothetical protein [Oscillatoriaceae cyanobacterium M7585_C2015_266]